MSNSHQPEDVAVDNESSLKALVRAIQFSQGQFRLILARCNHAGLRERMVQRLRELSPVEIRELILPESIKTLYTTIKVELGDEVPQALMVFGLESVSDIRTVLTSSNSIREEFSNNFPFPLVLWINDEVQQKLLRLVPDLESWATSVEFAIATDELLDLLRQKVKPLYTRDSTIHLEDYSELEAAWKDLQRREQGLEPDLEASLEFVRGLDNFARDRIDAALDHYQKSLTFWQQNVHLERQGILLTYIALAYYRKAELNRAESQQSWEESRHYLQQGIDAFEQVQRPDLVAKHISQLGEVLRRLQAWKQLQVLAEKALTLHQGDSRQLAQDYGFLAEVALEESNWNEAYKLAQQALQILDKIPSLQPYEQGLYRFLLARSQRHLSQVQEAIRNLEQAREKSKPQYNPELYIGILGELRSLYFEQGEYLAAFRIKQEQLQVEHQYGFRALSVLGIYCQNGTA
jgi:tetratricopeptide (TPR) repeat protein